LRWNNSAADEHRDRVGQGPRQRRPGRDDAGLGRVRQAGGAEEAALQGGANATHRGDPAFDTADFADTTTGNLRADDVLPDRGLPIARSFVFWPLRADPLFPLAGLFDPALRPDGNGLPSSDHRLVAVDAGVPRGGRPGGGDG